jgi:hypothetical protein
MSSIKQQFDSLQEKIKHAPEENAGQVLGKLDLLLEAKELAGDLWSAWENKAKEAKSTRKEVENHVKVYGAVLSPDKPHTTDESKTDTLTLVDPKEATTDKMREATAELVAKPYEDEENRALSASGHYKNKWESITEKINVLKKKFDFLNK